MAHLFHRLYNTFGARAPTLNSTEHLTIVGLGAKFEPGDGRSAQKQGGFQMAGLIVSLVISLAGGFITGIAVSKTYSTVNCVTLVGTDISQLVKLADISQLIQIA